jgi:hypothetical protein
MGASAISPQHFSQFVRHSVTGGKLGIFGAARRSAIDR